MNNANGHFEWLSPRGVIPFNFQHFENAESCRCGAQTSDSSTSLKSVQFLQQSSFIGNLKWTRKSVIKMEKGTRNRSKKSAWCRLDNVINFPGNFAGRLRHIFLLHL